ncbi:hypothetical protein F511_19749 [Dorcoceras hygrometricum]|uniref:Uncharacterized protein n=1 Tax=Dorcoceras hygrometricum TaxID=472368 RepID=A0A2Z7BDG3_9LAMI|nr:hypothetical protein F511_19749 [Dorcoceras hygrometricum]
MAFSLFVNTMQVNFEFVLTMEHSGMAKMFKSLEKVLTGKSVQTYIKKNLEIKPSGESSKQNEDTASNTEGGESQGAQPVKKSKTVNKKKMRIEDEPRQKKQKNEDTSSNTEGGESQGAQPVKKSKTVNKKKMITEDEPRQKKQKNSEASNTKMSTGERDDPQHGSIPAVPIEGAGMSAKENIATGSEEHERENREQDSKMGGGFQNEESQCQIEEQLLEWGETEQISKLFERSSLIKYKLYRLEVEKFYNEHLANFKLDAPSVNHDYLCIRRLHDEIKEIATLHKPQLALACLPIMDPEAPFAGLVHNQPLILALAFSSHVEQEKAVDHALIQPIVQHDSETVTSQDHQDHEHDPSVQEVEHQALDDEHQDHCEHNSLNVQQEHQGSGDNPTKIEDPSVHIVDIANNPGTHSCLDEHGTDHQDPSPSNLCMPPDSPQDNSKLDEVDKVVASIDSRMIYMESKLTSMDSRTLSLESKMQPLEFKLRSMNSHIERMLDTDTFSKLYIGRHKGIIYEKVDTLASTVKSSQTALETSIILQLVGQQQQVTEDLDMVNLQLAELVVLAQRWVRIPFPGAQRKFQFAPETINT